MKLQDVQSTVARLLSESGDLRNAVVVIDDAGAEAKAQMDAAIASESAKGIALVVAPPIVGPLLSEGTGLVVVAHRVLIRLRVNQTLTRMNGEGETAASIIPAVKDAIAAYEQGPGEERFIPLDPFYELVDQETVGTLDYDISYSIKLGF